MNELFPAKAHSPFIPLLLPMGGDNHLQDVALLLSRSCFLSCSCLLAVLCMHALGIGSSCSSASLLSSSLSASDAEPSSELSSALRIGPCSSPTSSLTDSAASSAGCQQTTTDISKPTQAANQDAPLLKSSSKVDLFDDPRYINTQNLQAAAEALETVEPKGSNDVAGLTDAKIPLWNEECYHGKISRRQAEDLLRNNGDFLVRESTTSPGQYVLSGLQGGQVKHLLLVDPEGKVRTKDHTFDSVDHLIRYHMENKLPIVSSGSELRLCQPVKKGLGATAF